MSNSTICLNMIVRNEAPVIERLLDSVCDIIDYYVIVDTGSEDNTVEVIENYFKNKSIKGKVYEREWVNFAHNRNEALQLAIGKADYALWADADEEVIVENKENFTSLSKDLYYINVLMGSLSYARSAIVRIVEDMWEWKGVVHEYIACKTTSYDPGGTIEGATVIPHVTNTGRSYNVTTKEKYLKDAKLLEDELERNPTDVRSRFYLAQSYRDAGERSLAIVHYNKRVAMGGWEEEVYMSQIYKATLMMSPKYAYSYEDIVGALIKAWSIRPSRAEALYWLAKYCRDNNYMLQANYFGKLGTEISSTTDILFVSQDIYDWKLHDEHSISSYYIDKGKECLFSTYKMLLYMKENPNSIPTNDQGRLLLNANYNVNKFLELDDKLDKDMDKMLYLLKIYHENA